MEGKRIRESSKKLKLIEGGREAFCPPKIFSVLYICWHACRQPSSS